MKLWLSRLATLQESRGARWLEQTREVLHEQFGERLTLVALAESANVHPAHLAREFRRFYRCTAGE